MSIMRAVEIPNFEQMTDLERLALAEDILGSLENMEALPSPIAHRFELDRRWSAYQADPSVALTKGQFREKVSALKQ